MRFNRLRLNGYVKRLYPFHKLEDGALFAYRRGQLAHTEYCVVVGVDDDDIYEDALYEAAEEESMS